MASEAVAKPQILLISLNCQSWFDETYDSLLAGLESKASIQRAKRAGSAIRRLSEQPLPSAVLITDEALTKKKNAHVWEAVLQYVRQGGTSVVMGHFSSFVPPLKMKPFFAKAGLPWEVGSYHRTTVVLNREAVGDDNVAAALPLSYSQKALFAKNVAPADAWYRPDEDSVVESRVFPPTSVNNVGESPVVLARVGDGRLGYVGDVNAEQGTDAAILAMCGFSM
jgi:hypothetical protein